MGDESGAVVGELDDVVAIFSFSNGARINGDGLGLS